MRALDVPQSDWFATTSTLVHYILGTTTQTPRPPRDAYGTPTGRLRDAYGTPTGRLRDAYGTPTGRRRTKPNAPSSSMPQPGYDRTSTPRIPVRRGYRRADTRARRPPAVPNRHRPGPQGPSSPPTRPPRRRPAYDESRAWLCLHPLPTPRLAQPGRAVAGHHRDPARDAIHTMSLGRAEGGTPRCGIPDAAGRPRDSPRRRAAPRRRRALRGGDAPVRLRSPHPITDRPLSPSQTVLGVATCQPARK